MSIYSKINNVCIKQMMSFLIVMILIVLGTGVTSYADEVSLGGNTNSGGSEEAGNDSAYAHKFMAYPENQGYRISIVDKNGDRVSNSVDIVNYVPNDMLYGNKVSYGNKQSKDETYIEGFNQYINYIGWNKTTTTKTKRFLYNAGIKTEEYKADAANWGNGGVPDIKGKYGTITTQIYPLEVIKSQFVSNYNYKAKENGASNITEADVKIPLPSNLNGNIFTAGGATLMEYLQKYMIKTGGSEANEADHIISNASTFVNMGVKKYNSYGEETSNYGYLFNFIESSKQSLIGTRDSTGELYTQSKIIAMNGYKVIIEPLYWYVPEILSVDSAMMSVSTHGVSVGQVNGVCYGTVSYIAKYAEDSLSRIGISDAQLKKTWVGPNWAGARLGVTTMMIATSDSDLGIREPSQAGLAPQASLADSYSIYDLAKDNNYKDIGYSLHIYDKVFVSLNALSTWDGSTTEGPAPTPSTAGIKNVVKFYMKKSADGNSYIPYKNFTTKNTPSTISIVNENDGKYKVGSWFTSTTFSEPSSDSTTYDSYYSNLNKVQAGNSTGTVTMADTTGETTLYLKLIADTSNSVVNLNGLQQLNLYQNELSYPYNLSSFRSDGSLEEIHYTFPYMYEEGVDEVEHTYHDVDADGNDTEETEIEYKPWHRRLVDTLYNLNILNTFNYDSTNYIGSQGVFAGREGGKVNTNNNERSADINGFNSESLNPNWTFTYYRDKSKDLVTLYPNKNTSGIINELSLIGISNPSYVPNQARVAASGEGAYTNTFNVGYDYGSLDKTLSWEEVGGDDRDGSGSYDGSPSKDISNINSVYNVENNLSTAYYIGDSTSQDTGSISTIDKSGFSHFGMTFADGSSSSLSYRKTFTSSNSMQFYPFVRMNYKTIDNTNGSDVIVTGNQLRNYYVNNTVDVSVYKKDASIPPLSLESNQWNMHSRTLDFLSRNDISDKESVLPGGAVYTLKGNDSGERWIGVRSYQVVLPDDSIVKKASGSIQSYSEAESALSSFLSEIPTVLSNYNIEQWVKRGLVEDGIYDTFQGSDGKDVAKVSGTNNSKSKLYTKLWSNEINYASVYIDGATSSTINQRSLNVNDDKYYLKANSEAVNGAKLSVVESKSDKIIWKLWSDEAGNVYLSNSTGLSVSINSKQSANDLLSKSADISTMNNRTKAVSNFIAAIERNKGTDRNGQPWYNEGFESIQIIESYNAYKLGFSSSSSVRSSAIDPKLTGYLKDRSDTFRYGDEDYYRNANTSGAPVTSDKLEDIVSNKVRSSIFKTSAYSESNPSTFGYLGTFDGTEITLGDMDFLLFSKNFYIPNATVMDLN